MAGDRRRKDSACAGRICSEGPGQRIAVDRVRQSTTDTSVVERRPTRVEAEIDRHPAGSPLHNRQLVGGNARQGGGHLVDQVVLSFAPTLTGCGRRRFEFDRHLADVSARPVPGGSRLDRDPARRTRVRGHLAADQDERTAADDRVLPVPVPSPFLVEVPRPGEQIRLAEQVEEVVLRLLEVDLERALVERARADSLEPGSGHHLVLAHPGVGERLDPAEVVRPRAQVQREAAVRRPAADVRAHPPGGHVDPADRVDELRERGKVHDDHVVDLDPRERLDGLDRERWAA